MLSKLDDDIRSCLEQAAHCARVAQDAIDDKVRGDYLTMERGWRALAQSFEMSRKIGDFARHIESLPCRRRRSG